MQTSKFKIGQVWKYHNRPGEDSSTITILKIEKYGQDDTVIHIRVDGIKISNPRSPGGYNNEIPHMPYSQKALLNSVTTQTGENNDLPDFSEGYNLWKKEFDKGRAGFFSIPVKEAVNAIDSSMKNAK